MLPHSPMQWNKWNQPEHSANGKNNLNQTGMEYERRLISPIAVERQDLIKAVPMTSAAARNSDEPVQSTIEPMKPASRSNNTKDSGDGWSSITTGILWSWVLIAGFSLIYLGNGLFVVYRRIFLHLEPVQDLEVIQQLTQCCRLAGVKKVPELYSSGSVFIPFVFGFLRPVIAVPDGFLHPSKQNELKYTLLHELTHINRKDNLWLPFERIFFLLYFFHPVMRWMVRVLNKEREYLCDQQVVRITNQKTEYAEFLLNTVWEYSQQNSNAYILPFADADVNVSNRVKQILAERKKTMLEKVREIVIASVLIAVVLPLAILTAPAQEKDHALIAENSIFAEPVDRDNPGSEYYIFATVEDINRVLAVPAGKKTREGAVTLVKDSEWVFNKESHILNIKIPIEQRSQRVLVFAKQSVPWEFKAMRSLKHDSVKILIGDRICEKDIDFSVDESDGIIKILKPELCITNPPCLILYDAEGENYPPRGHVQGTRDSDGYVIKPDSWDPKVHNRFLSLPENLHLDDSTMRNVSLLATDDPLIYEIPAKLKSHPSCVAYINKNCQNKEFRLNPNWHWLVEGKDYTVDEKNSQIKFISQLPFDSANDVEIIAHGIAGVKNIYVFDKSVEKGGLFVTLDGKDLIEGQDYFVDYSRKKLRITHPAIETKKVNIIRHNISSVTYDLCSDIPDLGMQYFYFGKDVQRDSIYVILDGKDLKEGKDYLVEYDRQRIKIIHPAIENRKVRILDGSPFSVTFEMYRDFSRK